MFLVSPAQFKKAGSWAEFAKAPVGHRPVQDRRVQAARQRRPGANDDYWDKTRVPKLDKIVLFPMPEATTRLSALRSGQVDWIEVPPPDAMPSLKKAGFKIVANSYPHVWPWVLNWPRRTRRFATSACATRSITASTATGW